MTLQIQTVLRVLLADLTQDRYGLEICEATSLPSGTVYPILARLEQVGWIESHWEEPDTHVAEGRPRRRYYKITQHGVEASHDAVARTYTARRQPIPGWLQQPRSAGGAL